MSGYVLRASGVGVRFGGVRALTDVDLDIRAGEVCGLIGPNGAGKTTLFDVLSGIRRPDRGRLLLDGADITRRSPVWRARHGMRRTFQRRQLFGQLSVADNVLVAQEWRGGGGGLGADLLALPARRARERERRTRGERVLADCGLAGLGDAYAGGLPVGRARMVELARAVADRPRVLLLDEPASGLSAPERERLAAVVRHLAREEGCAVLLVEHDVAFVMDVCARVVVLDLGTVLAEGTPAEVRANASVREAYLGTTG
ncbi:ABC transporter ATP-binding protein [Streptomyces subrutilus]|uniref:ABC transporter ATP-binding protein n=1 Tax=Streptomyces subrutilus TaxID=36818 RepID=A0A5P2UN05_9ACTN|nr:ABC transporter ATP-binding protein [Streptomyces subrutilus]QEU78027.1 ABC transporter ATP-binding protein [Streptomyces subrutilus]WSJ32822.1 ABC transporter ATP-binding protein [Streptomyces subrutilus]GGZ56723.1 ABC transporter ATP-binding protein [Streptomyces subrutilus]